MKLYLVMSNDHFVGLFSDESDVKIQEMFGEFNNTTCKVIEVNVHRVLLTYTDKGPELRIT